METILALLFYKENVPPLVIIRCKKNSIENYYTIDIYDNGIGFDEIHVEKIFGIFQRLVNKSEYPGTGIGLSICKKITERHDGTLSVSSTPGQGSVFSIHLPEKQNEP